MNFSISYLEKIKESEKLGYPVKEIISILLSAINDWPNPLIGLIDYEESIYKLIGKDIDRKKLEEYISKIDYSKNAWEAESLSCLIDIYAYYEEGVFLKEILKDVKDKIRKTAF